MKVYTRFLLALALVAGLDSGLALAAVGPLVTPDAVTIDGDLGPFKASWQWNSPEDGVQVGTLSIEAPEPATPPAFFLRWRFPSVEIYGYWNTGAGTDKTTYWGSHNRVLSRAQTEAPVISFYDSSDRNRFTFALSDALNLVDSRCGLREEDSFFYCSVGLLGEPMPPMRKYSVELRLDNRPVRFEEALGDVAAWWASKPNFKPAPVPEASRLPLYSTWYAFHQSLDPKVIVEELKIGKELGLKGVIVDDGWQTVDSQRGYAFTGDWLPERIPKMREFVDAVHDLDMKFVLWYSVPFIGKNAKNYPRFEGKYLWYWERQGAYVLDPRYPEAREFVIKTYEDALRDWNLDGLKLDFIGRFVANEKTKLTKEDGRDYASVNMAVDRLMTDVMARLRAIKPDVMIEFRQPYIGPLMRKYGNMFRASDCPNNAVINRIRIADLRVLSGDTAVHSDMFVWHPEEPVEEAALQILNILFAVPQLSVRLKEMPEHHLKMVKFWISYWRENRSVLLDGKFAPHAPSLSYPMLSASANGKRIVALYNDLVVPVKETEISTLDVVNAKGSKAVVLDLAKPLGSVRIEIHDTTGKVVESKNMNLDAGPVKFEVPASGLLTIGKT